MTDEQTILNDVYNHIFKNTNMIEIDFCEVFPASGIDNEDNVIYLAKNDQRALYKITIERI
jgi:hypothetical protein